MSAGQPGVFDVHFSTVLRLCPPSTFNIHSQAKVRSSELATPPAPSSSLPPLTRKSGQQGAAKLRCDFQVKLTLGCERGSSLLAAFSLQSLRSSSDRHICRQTLNTIKCVMFQRKLKTAATLEARLLGFTVTPPPLPRDTVV